MSIVELGAEECDRLLRYGVFGRLVLPEGPRGPEILPVHYATVDDVVLVRTSKRSILDRYADGALLLLEIDNVNYERNHGWSVVARGQGECLRHEDLSEAEQRAPGPPRWLGHEDATWVRLRWVELTGRKIGSGWNAVDETPVRRARQPRSVPGS